jgi:hypothetical protein
MISIGKIANGKEDVMKEARFGPWKVIFDPEDGARINSLIYEETELLTTQPDDFRAPEQDYGEYETRPVYGYDDCFPSVNVCTYPGTNWLVPDHGELCWLAWQVARQNNHLLFSVDSENLSLNFKREMHFTDNELTWIFTVTNNDNRALPFQHVMHPLMPLSEICDMKLPEFGVTYDEIAKKNIDLSDSKSVKDFLLSRPVGTTNMLFLQNVKEDQMSWTYKSGLCVEAVFPVDKFPSIGIWWNNNAYPDENGCRRNECAFEPIPGMTSTLTDAVESGDHLSVGPDQRFSWQILWRIK